jgi:outer membrane biogenesis lipoprotein LolB
MKSSLIWLLSPMIFFLFLEGCAHRPALVEEPRPAYFRDWLPALQERSEHWKSYQARVHLSAQTSEKKFNLDALVVAGTPDQFRLEAFRLGQTVGVLTLNHGQSSLFVPSEKVIYTAERSENLTDHFLGIALPLDIFGYSLSACVPPDQLEDLQIVPQKLEWVGISKRSFDGWSCAWQFTSMPQTIKSVSVKRGTWDYTIRYEPPVGLTSNEVPQKIIYSSANWQIELTVQELAPVLTLQEAVFKTDPAQEIRRVDIRSLK